MIPLIANQLRDAGQDVFSEWYAAGPTADDSWRDFEKGRGWTYERAIKESLAAKHVFEFDKYHLERADMAILVMPAGKSAFLELGWFLGSGKPGYILMDDQERWDVMMRFSTGMFTTVEELIHALAHDHDDDDTNCHDDANDRSQAQTSATAQAPNGAEGLWRTQVTVKRFGSGHEETPDFH